MFNLKVESSIGDPVVATSKNRGLKRRRMG